MDCKLPQRVPNSNKGTYGKVLNFSGSKNYVGAVYLSSISALKVGCGYVGISTEKNIIPIVASMLPDAVYMNRSEGVKSIDSYDVVAKHGSVVGTVNEDIMFYLMSRGISYNDALKLVIKGYLFSNVINDLNIKARILKVIDMYWR